MAYRDHKVHLCLHTFEQRHNNNGVVIEHDTAMPRRTTTPIENVRGYGRTAISEDPGPSTPRITNASHTNAARPYRPSWDKSVSNHLQAYILRPQLQHEVSAIHLSYIAEKLSLDSIKLEQHVDRLGPDHSIIDDVRNLQAEQYRQIDTVLKQRNGKLVSVHRDTLEMPTSMGHMHATTLTFVLSTTEPEGQEPSNESGVFIHPSSWCSLQTHELAVYGRDSIGRAVGVLRRGTAAEKMTHILPPPLLNLAIVAKQEEKVLQT